MIIFARFVALILIIFATPNIVSAQATCTTGRGELWFLNDESGSVSTSEFADAKSFMSSVASGFTFSNTAFRGAIVSWSDTNDQTIESSLTTSFVTAVSDYTRNYSNGTAPAEALTFAAPYITSTARTGVPSVVVMLTDATASQLTSNRANFISAANSIRATAGNEIVVMLIAEAAAAYAADATVKSTIDSVAGSASNVIVGSTYADIANPTKNYISSLTTTTCSVAATAALALPGVSFPTSGQDLSATEGGDTASIPVVLNSQPTNDVTVTVADANGQCTFTPSTLTFTSSNYSTAQSLTVAAVDDLAIEGSHSCTPVFTVTSVDPDYSGFDPIEPTVTIVDNDVPSTSTSTITANPTSIAADGTTTSTITVQLKDANGNNLTTSGGTVVLSTDLGTLGSVTDNGDGTYTATLTSATTVGTATISGTLAGTAITDTATVTMTTTADSDGDGKPDNLESSSADRDGDGIPDAQDYDPQGYFYCQEDGAILTGGSISVTGPVGTNSAVGTSNGITIIKDGSDGNYQWQVSSPGTYTMTMTYPGGGIPSTTHLSSGSLTLSSLSALGNPASIGHSEYGSTGVMSNFMDANTGNDAPTAFYTTFVIGAGDPYLIGNNIPLQNCSSETLIDEVKDRVTATLVEDFRRTVEMQQRSLSNISRDALLRMTDSYDDLRCGHVEELDADGIAEFKNGVGILAGTINQDFYNCLSGERIIDEGAFSFTRTDNLGVEAMFSIRRQWEHIVDDDELRGRYLGVDFNNSNIDNGAGLSGSVKGFGISGGGYGAFTTDKELYVDYYFGGSAGIRDFNLDYADTIGAVTASGDYTYGALFAGAALSGEKDMTDYVVTPRVGFDVALARASDANIQAERLNLTGIGTIVIPDHRIGNIYAEAIFSFGDEKPEENVMQDYWAYHVSPRAFCEFTSRSNVSTCGFGGYIEAKLYRYEQETDLGFRLDVSGTRNSRSMSIELLEERVIFGGLGTVTSTMGSALNGAMNVSTTLEMQY